VLFNYGHFLVHVQQRKVPTVRNGWSNLPLQSHQGKRTLPCHSMFRLGHAEGTAVSSHVVCKRVCSARGTAQEHVSEKTWTSTQPQQREIIIGFVGYSAARKETRNGRFCVFASTMVQTLKARLQLSRLASGAFYLPLVARTCLGTSQSPSLYPLSAQSYNY